MRKASLPEGFLIRFGSLEYRALKEGFDKKDDLDYKELRALRYVARVLLEEPAFLEGLKTEKQMAEKLAAYGEKSISYSDLSSVVRAYFIAPRARVLYSNE